jgi:hypothetical protein
MRQLRALAPALALCHLFASAACEPSKPATPAAEPAAQAEPAKVEAPFADAPDDKMAGLPKIPEPVLPTFTDPAEGPRAPTNAALGFKIGQTTRAELDALAAAHGFTCRDTSARAMFISIYNQYKEKGIDAMKGAHEGAPKGQSSAARAAPGEDLKKTGGHAHGDYAEMAKNPQQRLSCEQLSPKILTDRERPEVLGRLLMIFDSEAHPLRLASFARQHKDAAAALEDFHASLKAIEAVHGKPTESEGELGEKGFHSFVSIRRAWKYADMQVVLTGTGLGPNGAQIEERYDVPLPVRADAVAKR